MRFLSFILFLFVTLTCSGQTLVPMTLVDNRPFITVSVHGIQGKFLVDTGGRFGLDLGFARKLGLALRDSLALRGAGDGIQYAWRTDSLTYQVDQSDIGIHAPSPLVTDLSMIRDSLHLPYLDGIIGHEMFNKLRVTLDYVNRVIEFASYDVPMSTANRTIIPFHFYRDQIPQITGTINDSNGKFIVDTGDRSALTLFPEFAESLPRFSSFQLSDTVVTGYGIGGPVKARTFHLPDITFQDLKFQNILTRIPYHESGGWSRSAMAGSIGSGILRKFRVTFDYKNHRILMTKMPEPLITGFVYHSAHLDSTVAWYKRTFELKTLEKSSGRITLGRDDLRIQFINATDLPTLNEYQKNRERKVPNGVFKIGFTVEELHDLYARLQTRPDVELMGRLINFYGKDMFLIRDPEGNVLQFFSQAGFTGWQNSFAALITASLDQFDHWENGLKDRGFKLESNFDKPDAGIRQRNYVKGILSIELLLQNSRAEEAYNNKGASGTSLNELLQELQIGEEN